MLKCRQCESPHPIEGLPEAAQQASAGNKLRSRGSQLLQNENNLPCHWAEGRERIGERRKAPAASFMGGMQALPSIIMKILPFHTILNSPFGRSPDAVSVFSENTRGTEFFNLSSFLIILLC